MKSFINFTSWALRSLCAHSIVQQYNTQEFSSFLLSSLLHTEKHHHHHHHSRRLSTLGPLCARHKTAVWSFEMFNVVSVCSRLGYLLQYIWEPFQSVFVLISSTYIRISQLFLLSILTWKRLLTYFLFSVLCFPISLSANGSTVRHSSVWSSQRENTTTKLQRNWIISRRYYLCGREASNDDTTAWTAESARIFRRVIELNVECLLVDLKSERNSNFVRARQLHIYEKFIYVN